MATKWGIASCGMISHDFVNAITSLPSTDHKVVAVAARSLSSAQAFKDKFGLDETKAYEGYQALADDSEVEVVYIGSINTTHLELAKMMLGAGKHVLCEKPLCMNVKQTMELIEFAKEKKRFLMEAIWSRTLPSYQKIRQLIADGSIGEIAQLVMGAEKPAKIAAVGHLNEHGVDVGISASMTYSQGRTATIVTSAKAMLENEAIINGTKGMIRIASPFWTATQVELIKQATRTDKTIEKFNFELPQGAKLQYIFPNSNNLAHEAQHVRECILAGELESPLLPLDETLTIAQIMEEIRKQAGVVYNED